MLKFTAKKAASAVMAGALIFGTCVPAIAATSFVAPSVAVALSPAQEEMAAKYQLNITEDFVAGRTDGLTISDDVLCEATAIAGYPYYKITVDGVDVERYPAADYDNTSLLDLTTLTPGYHEITIVRGMSEEDTFSHKVFACNLVVPAAPTTLSLVTPNAAARMSTNSSVEDGVDYTAIKVLSADIEGAYKDADAPKASNIQFAEGVTGEIIAGDAEDDLSNPQTAAEYIAENIDHQPGVGLVADDYGMALAKRLMLAGAETQEVTADGGAVVLDGSGYYLIVRTDALTGESTAATSPIFAALGSGETEIELKVAIPTITKEVQEDSDGSWGDAADHSLNQEVNYRLIATMPDNFDAYGTYDITFNDEWEAPKLALYTDSVAVTVISADGTETDITTEAGVAIDPDTDGKLIVTIDDLKTIYPTLAVTDTVVVTYTAEQCGTSASPEGIENTAWLEYSNNPVFEDSIGTTPKVEVKDYSYALRIHKTDNATGEDLEGVEFSFKSANGNYLALNEDGEVIEQAGEYAWVTDSDGRILIDGVDADKYTIAETQALAAYADLGRDIVVTVNATDRDAVTGTFEASELVTPDAEATDADEVVSQILVKNIKRIGLPSTGEAGIALIIFLAIAGGVAAVARRRKDTAEDAFMTV